MLAGNRHCSPAVGINHRGSMGTRGKMVLALALIGLLGAPSARAEEPSVVESLNRVPVLNILTIPAFGMLGMYEDSKTYVSLRDAETPANSVGPSTDRDSAMFSGD